VDHVIFDKTGTLTLPSQVDVSGLSEIEMSIAKALAQVSNHALARALLKELADIPAANINDIQEDIGNGVHAMCNGNSAALGRGKWLGENFCRAWA